MKTRVAINGFGRIGRVFFRSVYKHPSIEVVAINDLADVTTMAHLLKYDSVHRQFDAHINTDEGSLIVDEKEINYCSIADPTQLPWKKLDIDVVIEATGL
ncbi:MAG: type I glyceraldehyde-3-phosphate dehydrogenase, partial [Flavobacteriales bacterium]|nr:type I glyceraldehyde-3-phosphate dehydrogenase [Flavobacteriales bacterium]